MLDGLQRDGLQSDLRFIEGFVRGRFAKGHGPQRIFSELRLEGFSSYYLDEHLDGCLAQYDWDAALAQVHDKKFGTAPPVDAKEYAARVRFLGQRGFEPHRIHALLQRLRRGEA